MGYLTANDRPGIHADSWYAATAGAFPDHPAVQGEIRADVCVIGGGYAGLSAALHLAERGVDVVLVEANRVGWGASGRNGGQLGVGPRADIETYERAIGREDARKVWEISIAANRLVRDLIAQHGIACDLVDGALYPVAKRADEAEYLAEPAYLAKHYGHTTARALTREEMADRLGTAAYHGGIEDRMGGHLHPLRYALGLARAAEDAGARIFERSRVTSLGPGRASLAAGSVMADTVLLAMNGYIDGLEPRVAARSLPINNFIAATEPMDPARAARIIPGNECVADSFFVLNYYRKTRDHRLLWGGGEGYGTRFPRDIGAVVRRAMLRIYPDLADLAFTHAWGGTLAITAPRFPLFQEVGKGVLSVSGWSGSGIHMATMGGRIAADAISGDGSAWAVLSRLPVPAFPGGKWFRAPLTTAALTWYALRDRL
ncbi:MAG: FAD-binding oxidoreductase [Pseudomonadota bacterium]